MATNSFFKIPGNIKQQFMPWVLNPSSPLNGKAKASTDVSGSPQFFTYKNSNMSVASGTGKLNFIPSSIDAVQIKDDISFKLLYGPSDEYLKERKSITVQDIFNTIPGVQIREFLPDTRLDQCINMFVDLFKNMTKLFTGDDNEENGSTSQQQVSKSDKEASIFKKIIEASWFTMKYMVGAYPDGDPSFLKDLGNLPGTEFSTYQSSMFSGAGIGDYVMKFPYILYYRLQSCVTTNIYEVPAVTSDKTIMKSGGGMKGWTDGGSDLMSIGGFRLSGLLGKIPVIGSLANMILGNVGINYMPWWNAESGTKTQEPQVEIKFDLFNDSLEAAMINFIFVNTLVPGNKWIQYNMFQHSSCLYDVKIEGINRLFACAGDFTVTYDGVLRDPPEEFVWQLTQSHANQCMNKGELYDKILKQKLIKIPDVYRVTMQFQSLLPANFNNFLFTYAQNNNIIEDYKGKTYQSSAIAELLPNAISQYTERVINVWKDGDEKSGGGNAGKAYNDKGQLVDAKELEEANKKKAQQKK